jgi:hypothetical protein
MDVTNKSKKPLMLPLPGNKKLFLGPGKTGQVSPKALEHPPLAKLIESGDVVAADGDHKETKGGSGSSASSTGLFQGGPSGAPRQSGDR